MNRSAVGLLRSCALQPGLLGAIGEEFEAQIRWALDRGVRPTHLDSHRHVHAFPPLFARTAALAQKYDIPFVRWPWERLAGAGWPEAPVKQRRTAKMLNCMCLIDRTLFGAARVGTAGTWGIAHTGRISVEWLLRAAAAIGEDVVEIMTHPGLSSGLEAGATRLVESRQTELAALCRQEVKDAFEKHRVELIHYGHLARQLAAAGR